MNEQLQQQVYPISLRKGSAFLHGMIFIKSSQGHRINGRAGAPDPCSMLFSVPTLTLVGSHCWYGVVYGFTIEVSDKAAQYLIIISLLSQLITF